MEKQEETYTVLEKGSQKRTKHLISSFGYSYGVKRTNKNSVLWRCNVRNRAVYCPATVLQQGDTFTSGLNQHVHPAVPDRKLEAEGYTKVHDYIRQLMALPFLPAAHIRPTFEALERRATSDGLNELVGYIQTTMFDPTMKKKKKKKKTGFDPEALEAGEPAVTETPAETPAVEEVNQTAEQTEEKPVDDDFSLDFGGTKKKKKKKKVMDMEEMKEALPTPEHEEEIAEDGGTAPEPKTTDPDLSLPMKKKKKKKNIDFDELTKNEADLEEGFDAVDSAKSVSKGKAWLSSDRDYTYDELLTRVFDIIREKNPEMVAGEKKKIVMRPPQVLRAGARRTSFANFAEISRMLHRQSKHVLAFLLAELGTSGSVDGNNQLIIRGRFNQKQIENVLRRYIKEYVTCHTCKSPDTLLQKEERLFFLQCETCGSRCSVASIKSGFQAVTGRRAAMRANAH